MKHTQQSGHGRSHLPVSPMGLARLGATCSLIGALVLWPAVAFAQGSEGEVQETQPATASLHDAAQEQFETRLTVASPQTGTRAMYLLGDTHDIQVSLRALDAEANEAGTQLRGTFELFSDETLLGTAPVAFEAGATSATVTIRTDQWGRGGAHEVTARFVPEPESPYQASESQAQTYRVVDTKRMVDDIELAGEPAAAIEEASLEWTIGNIWFSNFRVGFHREVVEGNVSLPELTPGTSNEELQRYYWRPFTFSGGSGEADASGNRVITFTGTARLTSGSGNQWNFTDPVMHVNKAGDGYITAEFSGFYNIESEQVYEPTRVTIATFNAAELDTDEAGITTATAELNWEGQSNGAGTWALNFNASFPNEFVALLNPGVNLFFTESSIATDSSKIPHPIRFSFTEKALDGGGENPGTGEPGEENPGTSETPGTGEPGAETPGAETPGEETPGSEHPGVAEPGEGNPAPGPLPDTNATVPASDAERLSATGASSHTVLAWAAAAAMGAGLLFFRRRRDAH